VDDLTHPSCDLCRAIVPRDLTHFRKLWQSQPVGHRLFAIQDVDPAVAQLLQMMATLRAIPPVTARAEFVYDLRERLMAQTTE
jgi:hypothetical protein